MSKYSLTNDIGQMLGIWNEPDAIDVSVNGIKIEGIESITPYDYTYWIQNPDGSFSLITDLDKHENEYKFMKRNGN
jgi:hypothetical protein